MGSAERRDRERLETRLRILDAARDLFVRDGFDRVTMRAVADRIEYTPTAIYHHFRDKQALLTELCHHDFRALAGTFQRVMREPDPVERLRKLGHAYVDFALEHPSQYRFLFMTEHPPGVQEQPEQGNPEEDAYYLLHVTVEACIAAGRMRPEYGDADVVSQICWANCHGLVSLYVTFGQDDWLRWADPRRTAALGLDALLRGMLRDAG